MNEEQLPLPFDFTNFIEPTEESHRQIRIFLSSPKEVHSRSFVCEALGGRRFKIIKSFQACPESHLMNLEVFLCPLKGVISPVGLNSLFEGWKMFSWYWETPEPPKALVLEEYRIFDLPEGTKVEVDFQSAHRQLYKAGKDKQIFRTTSSTARIICVNRGPLYPGAFSQVGEKVTEIRVTGKSDEAVDVNLYKLIHLPKGRQVAVSIKKKDGSRCAKDIYTSNGSGRFWPGSEVREEEADPIRTIAICLTHGPVDNFMRPLFDAEVTILNAFPAKQDTFIFEEFR